MMKILYKTLGLTVVFGLALLIAVLITPINFLMLQIILLGTLFLFYFSFKDMTNGVIVWLLSLLFVMFTKIPLGIGLPSLSLDRVLYLFLVTYYFLHVVTSRVHLRYRAIEALMLVLCSVSIFSIIRMKGTSLSREILDAYSFLFNTYIVSFTAFIIAKDFINDEQKIHKLFVFLSIILLYLSATSIFENFKLTNLLFPKDIMNPAIGIHFGRSRGPFLQAAINGTVLGMLSITNLYMAINARRLRKIFFIAISILSPVAIFFTYTRAAWLAFLLSFTFMLFLNRKFRKYIVCLVLLGLILLIPLHLKIVDMERLESRVYQVGPVYDRINLYHTYLAMFKDRPFLGFGFANFNRYSHEYFSKRKRDDPYVVSIPTIHDTFAGTLVELGGVGFLVFISILMLIFRKSLFLFRQLKGEGFMSKGIVVAFWAMAIAYIINAFFIDMKYHLFHNVIFYLLAGIIVGLYERQIKCKTL